MRSWAYYNEIDAYAAQWLRNLIAAGHIAPGEVDERSIEDVHPLDVKGFVQCHFFAGIGVWSHALRMAGWEDSRPVWTGSCPCQPFSQAGEGVGFDDERHLWPHFHHLIKECSPAAVFGEQVASKDAGPWIDLVHTDLEALGYAFGAVPFPSAGVGAPHIRDRLYWVANADGEPGRQGRAVHGGRHSGGDAQSRAGLGSRGLPVVVGQPTGEGPQGSAGGRELPDAQLPATERAGEAGGLGDAEGCGRGRRPGELGGLRSEKRLQAGEDGGAGPVNGFWRAADWLFCRDAKWRPVEPESFPLAHGAAARVGRLRGYGNAINAQAAQAFIEAADL